jgi:hypothetical protein
MLTVGMFVVGFVIGWFCNELYRERNSETLIEVQNKDASDQSTSTSKGGMAQTDQ